MQCELCGRAGVRITRHHLVPREEDGADGPTAELCEACHAHVHRLYDNRHLARELNTLELLAAAPEMRRFLAFVRKQDPGRQLRPRKPRAVRR